MLASLLSWCNELEHGSPSNWSNLYEMFYRILQILHVQTVAYLARCETTSTTRTRLPREIAKTTGRFLPVGRQRVSLDEKKYQ